MAASGLLVKNRVVRLTRTPAARAGAYLPLVVRPRGRASAIATPSSGGCALLLILSDEHRLRYPATNARI